jgi:hypothetical protein
MAFPVPFAPGAPPTGQPFDTWPERLNGIQEGVLEDAPIDVGSSGSPDTSGAITVSFVSGTSGIVRRALYVIVWLGASGTFTLAGMEAGVLSSATVEVHQVGASARTLSFRLSNAATPKTEGGTGMALTPVAGAFDIAYLWTPDGTSLRGSIAKAWA